LNDGLAHFSVDNGILHDSLVDVLDFLHDRWSDNLAINDGLDLLNDVGTVSLLNDRGFRDGAVDSLRGHPRGLLLGH